MSKNLFLILTAIFILSCSTLLPQKEEPATQSNELLATPTHIVSGDDALVGFIEVRLHPQDGNLDEMLTAEAQKAVAAKRLPVVEFDADWCPPCQAINKHLEDKNELMLKAYDGTYIIKLDVDEWGWNNGKVQNFAFEAIPIYFKLDEQGKPTGETIDGGAWNEDIPVNIAPVMDAFFHNQ